MGVSTNSSGYLLRIAGASPVIVGAIGRKVRFNKMRNG
jgi:hypothetical protein